MSVGPGPAANRTLTNDLYIEDNLPRETERKSTGNEWAPLAAILPRVVEDSVIAPSLVAYWQRTAIDALLELASAREQLGELDDDRVEVAASAGYDFYRRVGGTTLSLDDFRHKCRHYLRTGEELSLTASRPAIQYRPQLAVVKVVAP